MSVTMVPGKLLVATTVAAALCTSQPTGWSRPRKFMRGMVVSCPRWGPIWGSEAMARSLDELGRLGVDWIAIHPYGWVGKDGSIRFRPAAELEFLDRAVTMTEAAGIRLFWKPHLGYWGAFPDRGAIDFGDDPSAWARFFRDYGEFIVDQARFAADAGVELFAVGVELERTMRYEGLWRSIIRRVRAVYGGKIVYAANWDRLGTVPFWDAVDFLGVHAYFPLSEEDDPRPAAINRGWDRHLSALERLSRETGKPVLVAEIGYNSTPDAARTPWAYETRDSPEARELRARLIDVAVTRLEDSRFIHGMFWWKWMPGPSAARNFSMRAEEARKAIGRRWGAMPPALTSR